jgi:hypothetical protein
MVDTPSARFSCVAVMTDTDSRAYVWFSEKVYELVELVKVTISTGVPSPKQTMTRLDWITGSMVAFTVTLHGNVSPTITSGYLFPYGAMFRSALGHANDIV